MLIEYFSLFGLFLTVVAFCLSIWQSLEAKTQAKELLNIADALSTEYIGAYPEYMVRISDILSQAKSEIIIVCSLPIHGIYNAHDSWLKTKHSLEKALSPDSDINVSCVFADKSNRAALIANQYLDVKSRWEDFRVIPENHRKIKKYLDVFSKGVDVSELSFNDFLDLFEKISLHEMNSTYCGADIVEISYRPPLYMWIIDRKAAIFEITTFCPSFFGEAFWTTDARLINALINMKNEYCSNAVTN